MQTKYSIDVSAKTVRYKSQTEPTLFSIDLKIPEGEKVLIAGKSGSGKSTLAHMINGLIPHSIPCEVDGHVRVCGLDVTPSSLSEVSKRVGTVLQDPDGQFVGLTVGEDIAFALENDCVPRSEMIPRVQHTADIVHMGSMLKNTPHELSGGQKQRVTLAGVMVDDVDVLLFDEPLANLDPATGKYAIELIDDIHKQTGKTIVIIEHRLEDVLHRHVDRVILLEEGRIVSDCAPGELLVTDRLKACGIREPLYITALNYAGLTPSTENHIESIETLSVEPYAKGLGEWFAAAGSSPAPEPEKELLSVSGLFQQYDNGFQAIRGIDFTMYVGEIVALLGQNGAGKSTLSRVICGMEKPQAGGMLFMGADISPLSIAARSMKIGLVMQDPNHMLSKPMIYDEVALGLRARGISEDETKERVYDILKVCGLYPMRNWPISALSFGQKKRVTVASVLALGCELLILDEPTAGQDFSHYTDIMEFLVRLNRERNITLLFITHDMHLALEYTDRAIVMANGKIIADAPTAAVFSDDAVIKEASLRHTSLYELAQKAGLDPETFISRFIAKDREEREAREKRPDKNIV